MINSAHLDFSSYQIAIKQIKDLQTSTSLSQSFQRFRQDLFNVTITTMKKSDNPYVTAKILGSNLVSNFTIGDGKYYNGYYNAPLERGSTYRVFVRAVTKAQNGVSVIYWK
jgi:hypothetical protein